MWKQPKSTENHKLKANIIVFDVGSTYTKTSAFRLEGNNLGFLGRSQAPTTLDNILIGVNQACELLQEKGICIEENAKTYATCSAYGGLRMVALGYMPRVTAKAAKEVAMTAGARVMEVISFDEPQDYRVEVLQEIRPDIILLAGGTDGGDQKSVMENVEVIIKSQVPAKVIIACNRQAQAAAASALQNAGIEYVRVPNIMPTIHELNVKPAREAIHDQFIRQLTQAKGLEELRCRLTDRRVIPTPGAVLLASELLAKGTYEEEGIGGLVLIDIGGATTDIHSALPELDKLELEERGLIINNEKQFSYRTVEGNLGMRVSATGIVDTIGPQAVIRALPPGTEPVTAEEVWNYAEHVEHETKWIPQNEKENALDEALAICAINLALRRHAGYILQITDPTLGLPAGSIVGRDLRLVKNVVAVGGIFTHSAPLRRQRILTQAFANPGISLLPTNPCFFVDENYLFYALGVLSQYHPDAVLSFLKKYLPCNQT